MNDPISALLTTAAQLAVLVLVAPGLNGLVKRLKAVLQGRHGPPVLQPYHDLLKLLRKDSVVSEQASAVTRWAPAVYAAAFAAAALLVPAIWLPAPLAPWGDALLIVGLFALARFTLALAGLDTGSAFGGIGSSREVAVAALAEPALLLALFAVAWRSGGTDVSGAAAWLIDHPSAALDAGQILAGAALFITIVAETGRVPADNPDTHLELTMIHEGMLLEYSGRPLGILLWATLLKQVVLFALLVSLFAPFGLAVDLAGVPVGAAAFIAKLAVVAGLMALVESANAKVRILKLPELLGAGAALAVLALVTELVVG